ncbi:MAG: hypothetical protein IJM51_03165 [Clostridia bacterium]|nr:hypothetical protein [Clostridia bacterium]
MQKKEPTKSKTRPDPQKGEGECRKRNQPKARPAQPRKKGRANPDAIFFLPPKIPITKQALHRRGQLNDPACEAPFVAFRRKLLNEFLQKYSKM